MNILLKNFHIKMVSTFNKLYVLYFGFIFIGLLELIHSINKSGVARKLIMAASILIILGGIIELRQAYKSTKNKV